MQQGFLDARRIRSLDAEIARCTVCDRTLADKGGPGPPPQYCSNRCGMRAFTRRRRGVSIRDADHDYSDRALRLVRCRACGERGAWAAASLTCPACTFPTATTGAS